MLRIWLMFVVVCGLILAVQPAHATVEWGRPYDSGNLSALQGVLDGLTVTGPSSVNVVTDQVADSSLWSITASGASATTLIVEMAGYASTNALGVYDAANPASTVQVFAGAAVPGNQALLSIKVDGSVYLNNVDTMVDFAGKWFGFYLDSPDEGGQRFYSDDTLNEVYNGYYSPHMLAFQGQDDLVQLPNLPQATWTDNEYVMAWEDYLNDGTSDEDFTDMVVMVESVQPVPETASIGLWGMIAGVFGLGCWFRRRRQI